jgi:hypothetical protein
MKQLDFSLIGTGMKAPGSKITIGAMQEHYMEMFVAMIKSKIGNYDSTKAYMFGSATMVFYYNGDDDPIFTAPDGGYCLFDGIIYTVAAGTSADAIGAKLGISVVPTNVDFDNNIDGFVSTPFVKDYQIVQNNATGTILNTDIVPLFIYEIVTDWVLVPRQNAGPGNVYVRREGATCYLTGGSGNGSGSGNDFFGTVPPLFRPLALQRVLIKDTNGTIGTYEIGPTGAIICDGNTPFDFINSSYSILKPV